MIYKPIQYLFFVFAFYIFFVSQAFSQDEPSQFILETDDWYYDVDEDNGLVWMMRNGKVTHGDKLRFLIETRNCDIVRETFTFYTMMDHPKIDALEERTIGININGKDVGTKIQFVMPFLSGHAVWFDMGRYWVDEHIDFYEDTKVYKVKLFDQKNFIADKYFDVKFNEWDMVEFGKHLQVGQKKCKQLPQPLKS
jgi:hypothetical protein